VQDVLIRGWPTVDDEAGLFEKKSLIRGDAIVCELQTDGVECNLAADRLPFLGTQLARDIADGTPYQHAGEVGYAEPSGLPFAQTRVAEQRKPGFTEQIGPQSPGQSLVTHPVADCMRYGRGEVLDEAGAKYASPVRPLEDPSEGLQLDVLIQNELGADRLDISVGGVAQGLDQHSTDLTFDVGPLGHLLLTISNGGQPTVDRLEKRRGEIDLTSPKQPATISP